VYILNSDKGFEVARKGTNGLDALVARTGDDAMRGSWPLAKYPEDVLYPISFDSAGAEAQMRVFFDIAEDAGERNAFGSGQENHSRPLQDGILQGSRTSGCVLHDVKGSSGVRRTPSRRRVHRP
jgi:hypothetical protein